MWNKNGAESNKFFEDKSMHMYEREASIGSNRWNMHAAMAMYFCVQIKDYFILIRYEKETEECMPQTVTPTRKKTIPSARRTIACTLSSI
jgi:hypothetical protein